jgi:hypothetical protein
MDWSAFEGLPMPPGLSAQQTWEIIDALRINLGSNGEVYADAVAGTYHVATKRILELLMELDKILLVPSLTCRAIQEWDFTRLFIKPLVLDTLAALQKDGIQLDYETVRGLLLGEREPSNQLEKVVRNAHELFLGFSEFASDDFNEELLDRLFKRTIGGGGGAYPLNVFTDDIPCGPLFRIDPATARNSVIKTGGRSDKHPLLTVMELSFMIWEYRPYRSLNGLMELNLRRLVFLRCGYLPFALIPYSKIHQSYIASRANFYVDGVVTSTGIDFTKRSLALLSMIIEEARLLEETARVAEAHNQGLLDELKADPYMNHRQIEIIAHALRTPSMSVSISDYCKRFGIVKASSRSDLFKLCNMGFFRKEFQDRMLVFLPVSDLPLVIRNHKPFTLTRP